MAHIAPRRKKRRKVKKQAPGKQKPTGRYSTTSVSSEDHYSPDPTSSSLPSSSWSPSSYFYLPSYKSTPVFSQGAVGFKNEGNTCYFNAMLQTVLNAHPFVKPLLESARKGEEWMYDKCATALERILISVHEKDCSSPLSTSELRYALLSRDPMFTDRCQHGSWVALSHLLSQLAAEWSAANPEIMHCPIATRFERPFGQVPAEVSHQEFAAFNKKILVDYKMVAKPIDCFYAVTRDSLKCQDCLQTSTHYSATLSLEVRWDAVGCAVRVICVENGELKGTKVCKPEAGLGEDSTIANLRNVLTEHALAKRYDHQLLFFSLFFEGNSLKTRLVKETTTLSMLSKGSLVAVRSDDSLKGDASDARLAFSFVIGADGRRHVIEGMRDVALIPSGALLSGSNSIDAVCAKAIGLDECKIDVQSEDREFNMYVAYDNAVLYEWNKDKVLKSSASLPLVLVLWHRANAHDSALGRRWKLPPFWPKLKSIKLTVADIMSATMAIVKKQNPAVVVDMKNGIEYWNRQVPVQLPVDFGDFGERSLSRYCGTDFCQKASDEVATKWKLKSSPLLYSKRFLSREGLLTLDDCILQSERKIECSFADSRCLNPECAKRTKSFTRNMEMVLPPPVLAVHLNRDVDGSDEKDCRPVECPLRWEFKGVSYQMVGASIHSGYSMRGGHYTAKARNMHSAEWFSANDTSITGIAKPAAVSYANLVVYVRSEEEEFDEIVEDTYAIEDTKDSHKR